MPTMHLNSVTGYYLIAGHGKACIVLRYMTPSSSINFQHNDIIKSLHFHWKLYRLTPRVSNGIIGVDCHYFLIHSIRSYFHITSTP